MGILKTSLRTVSKKESEGYILILDAIAQKVVAGISAHVGR